MAQIKTEVFTITISKLHKNNGEVTSLVSDDFVYNVETIVQELLGNNAIVEVEELNYGKE